MEVASKDTKKAQGENAADLKVREGTRIALTTQTPLIKGVEVHPLN